MKKLLIALLCVAMALSLAACGGRQGSQDPGKGSGSQDTVPGGTENKTPEGENKTPGGEDNTPGGEDNTPGGEDTTPTPPPIFPGIGGFAGPGGGSGEQEDIPVADAGELVDTLDDICQGIIEGSYTETLKDSASFSNYFGGKLQYTEGMRVAANHLMMAPPAHIVMLIEVPEGKDPQDFAKELEDNANPRWLVCAAADSVQTAVKDDLVLFVMSSEETANAVIAAFNG